MVIIKNVKQTNNIVEFDYYPEGDLRTVMKPFGIECCNQE